MGRMGIMRFTGPDPCPLPESSCPYRLYQMEEKHGCKGVFLRHVVGDAADPEVIEPIMETTVYHTAIVLGTQATIRLPAKSRDTRVLCIMLLLRKICSVKLKKRKENIPMHVVGENQGVSGRQFVIDTFSYYNTF